MPGRIHEHCHGADRGADCGRSFAATLGRLTARLQAGGCAHKRAYDCSAEHAVIGFAIGALWSAMAQHNCRP